MHSKDKIVRKYGSYLNYSLIEQLYGLDTLHAQDQVRKLKLDDLKCIFIDICDLAEARRTESDRIPSIYKAKLSFTVVLFW